jgi:hypothetical protein
MGYFIIEEAEGAANPYRFKNELLLRVHILTIAPYIPDTITWTSKILDTVLKQYMPEGYLY